MCTYLPSTLEVAGKVTFNISWQFQSNPRKNHLIQFDTMDGVKANVLGNTLHHD